MIPNHQSEGAPQYAAVESKPEVPGVREAGFTSTAIRSPEANNMLAHTHPSL